jgi:hypothetical protein
MLVSVLVFLLWISSALLIFCYLATWVLVLFGLMSVVSFLAWMFVRKGYLSVA